MNSHSKLTIYIYQINSQTRTYRVLKNRHTDDSLIGERERKTLGNFYWVNYILEGH